MENAVKCYGEGNLITKRPCLGIAFGGGALKGLAHVGILKVLEEYGIHADMVSGTSIGSAIAAMYAAGLSSQDMEYLFKHTDIENILRVRPNRMGLIPAEEYTDMIRAATNGCRIENMSIPLYVVAVDLVSGKQVVFDRGDTAITVRASSAIPGVMTPVRLGDMMLVDGYVINNCPGNVLRERGADVVLAIDLSIPNRSFPTNMLDVVNQSLHLAASIHQVIDADLILRPIDRPMDGLDVDIIDECFALGEACARDNIDKILSLVEK